MILIILFIYSFLSLQLPIVAVVGNDACWTQIAREQKPMLGSDVACNLAYVDYHKVVEGFGAKGMVLDAPDQQKIKEKFLQALELNSQGNSVLINTLLGKSKFREGSISV